MYNLSIWPSEFKILYVQGWAFSFFHVYFIEDTTYTYVMLRVV